VEISKQVGLVRICKVEFFVNNSLNAELADLKNDMSKWDKIAEKDV